MQGRPLAHFILGALLTATSGCGFTFPTVGRTAPPVALRSGEPQGECEAKDWLDLVPAAAETGTWTPGTRTYERGYTQWESRRQGHALYPRAHPDGAPIPLDEDVPQIRDKALLARHMAPSLETLRKDRQFKILFGTAGVVALASAGATGGILAAGVDQQHRDRVFALLGVLGATVFLEAGLLIAGGVIKPGGPQANVDNLRRAIFLPSEDLDAVGFEVSQHNLEVRARCTPKASP